MPSPLSTPPKRFVRWTKNSRVDIDSLLAMAPRVSPDLVRDLVKVLARIHAAEGFPTGEQAYWALRSTCDDQVSDILATIFEEQMRAEEEEARPEREAAEAARNAAWKAKQKKSVRQGLRMQVFERDGFRCLGCGAQKQLSVDHVVPECRGGETTLENLQTLCRSCNNKKGAKLSA